MCLFWIKLNGKCQIKDFYQSTLDSLMSRTEIGTNGCIIFVGNPSSTYGRLNVQFPGKSKQDIYVHRLAWMLHNGVDHIPVGFEASHLCHIPKCVAIDHIRLETHAENQNRQTCNRYGFCVYEHDPECIF